MAGEEEDGWWRNERKMQRLKKSPLIISLHLDLHPPSSYSSAGWAVSVLWPAQRWSPRGQKRGSKETRLRGRLTVLQGWAVSGNVFPTLCNRYQQTPKAQFNLDLPAWLRQMDEQQGDYGEEEEAAWYLTKAMAASSLQNSSSTITPSSRVMWSTLQDETDREVRGVFQKSTQTIRAQNHVEARTWCPLALDPVTSSSQAAVWVWSRGCAESSTWDLPPPYTHTRAQGNYQNTTAPLSSLSKGAKLVNHYFTHWRHFCNHHKQTRP